MQPSSAPQLFEFLKSKNPSRIRDLEAMYKLFQEYKSTNNPSTEALKILKKVETALTETSKRKIKLRDIQLMNILMLAIVAKGRSELAEIKTGEGKSNIIKVVAAFMCLMNPDILVDIVTTGDTLAKKDAEDEETRGFFKKLEISMDHVIEIEKRKVELKDPKQNPLLARVLYGTPFVE